MEASPPPLAPQQSPSCNLWARRSARCYNQIDAAILGTRDSRLSTALPASPQGLGLDSESFEGHIRSLAFLDDGPPSADGAAAAPITSYAAAARSGTESAPGPVLAVLSAAASSPLLSLLSLFGLRSPLAACARGPPRADPCGLGLSAVVWSRCVRLELPRRALLPLQARRRAFQSSLHGQP